MQYRYLHRRSRDIEACGIQIFVGFKGAKPMPLDAYTQSGGERTTATMTFLLALLQHFRSPFRAVDEYDIHMDPRNREIIANLLVSSVSRLDAKYLAITPSQINFTENDVHVITLQNIERTSHVKELAKTKTSNGPVRNSVKDYFGFPQSIFGFRASDGHFVFCENEVYVFGFQILLGSCDLSKFGRVFNFGKLGEAFSVFVYFNLYPIVDFL